MQPSARVSKLAFIVLVCGGRTYGNEVDEKGGLTDKALKQRIILVDTLQSLHDRNCFTHVMHGGANGADTLAGAWAKLRGIQTVVCAAGWDLLGKAAGYIRNKRMAELEPDLVVAFPGGRGTANMVQIAKERGITVHEVTE